MAFMKYAKATVVEPQVSGQRWSKTRTAAGGASPNLIAQASEILGEQFDPNQYLLTHATIVCSVDVATSGDPSVKLGKVLDPNTGKQINRKFADYRIEPGCDKYVNNNHDAWSRPVLMKSFRTFVGGHNFVEHVQKEEESKGRIIDAVARNIGDSVYIDILIATNRRHAALVQDIESGKMSTLSMGCSVTETTCTKCGNVAADETEMCSHIRYEKGNKFFDASGKQHRIAELCGHESIDPNAGVQFIEASWVATPAFGGAVMRNILTPTGMSPEMLLQAAQVLSEPPAQWQSGLPREASVKSADYYAPDGPGHILGGPGSMLGFDFGDDEESGGEGEAAPPAKEEKKPFDALEDEVYRMVLDRVNQRVDDDLKGRNDKPSMPEVAHSTGEDIVRQAAHSKVYQVGLEAIVKTASSDAHLMNSVAVHNTNYGVKIPRSLYVTALDLGPLRKHGSVGEWAVAAHSSLQRTPSLGETKTLLRLGKLLDQMAAFTNQH